MSPLTYIIREPLHNVTNHLCPKEWEPYWDTQEEDGSGHSSSSSSSSSKCTYNTLIENTGRQKQKLSLHDPHELSTLWLLLFL